MFNFFQVGTFFRERQIFNLLSAFVSLENVLVRRRHRRCQSVCNDYSLGTSKQVHTEEIHEL